jgi:Na+/H+ antiporter NhaD/arsenite permease-like protein
MMQRLPYGRGVVVAGVAALALVVLPQPAAAAGGLAHAASHGAHQETVAHPMPSLVWVAPFVGLLLSIALLPLIPQTSHWWEHNHNKLLVALVLSGVALAYYALRGTGFHGAQPGLPTMTLVLGNAVLADYVPFIVLLFSLYVISGGISLRGDLPAHPVTNSVFLALGAIFASLIGTTGASMLLIRPLLQVNSERKHVRHTVIFFIFMVSNIGGLLLPLGDPPLFLGYLRGVPFFWTLTLWKEWLFACGTLLVIYYLWDSRMYRREAPEDITLDETRRQPLQLRGALNIALLLGVVASVATLVPDQRFVGTDWYVKALWRELGYREIALLGCALLSMWLTPKAVRKANDFNFTAIGEVACLFIGIFITMQIPIEILQGTGPMLKAHGLSAPWFFFWASGGLSSFLDNAPTYVVYFETARSLGWGNPSELLTLTMGGTIAVPLLTAVSLGSVFMGANSYIGNGPNFMVKSIAEQAGVKMPSFFGYMLYSVGILIPLFLLITFLFIG